MTPREIRRAGPEDMPAITEIFRRGVRDGAAPRHDAAQRAASLPEWPHPEALAERLSGQTVWVSEEAGRVTGLVTLRADGYLDFAFVLPEQRGTGTSDALLAMLENHAAAQGLRRLTVRAPDMARPGLARPGWTGVASAPQTRDGVVIRATDMARAVRAIGPFAIML